jgi:hypothetical protein
MKRKLAFIFTLVLAIITALPVAPVLARQSVASGNPIATDADGKVYAVVIGINNYPGHALNYCVNDADAFESLILEKAPDAVVMKLENGNATKQNIMDGLIALQSAVDTDDDVIVYYSGHGTNGHKGQSGIVAYDGVNGGTGIIWSSELGSALKGIHAKRIAVMLDCCYGNGFAGDLNLPNVLAMLSSAGLSGETALFGHGVFTYWFLVQGIDNGLADKTIENKYALTDSKIPFEEAFDYAFQNMTGQKPKVVDNVAGDYWLN